MVFVSFNQLFAIVKFFFTFIIIDTNDMFCVIELQEVYLFE
jgi:hypothetical protein